MHKPVRARAAAAAALAATSLALTASLPAQATTATGWRIVYSHSFSIRSGDAFNSVVAPTKTTAWAFGSAGTPAQGSPGTPIALVLKGTTWQNVALPTGLNGGLGAASAPAGNDIWVVSFLGGYILHYNGTKWVVAKTLPKGPTPQELTDVIAFSPTNVWVFGGNGAWPGFRTWHLHGTTWSLVQAWPGRFIVHASAVSAANIWAIGWISYPGDTMMRYNGTTWTQVSSPALNGLRFSQILALSATSIWVTATPAAGGATRLLHYNGTKWAQVATTPLVPTTIARDGLGGLWLPALSPTSHKCWLLHVSSAGKLTQTQPAIALGYGIYSLALLPGTSSLWGAGGPSAATPFPATIWAYGPVP